MVYTLVDGVFFDSSDKGSTWSAKYCEGMPFEYINREHADQHRLIVMMGFDGQRRDLDSTIKSGIGFEPWLWYWAPSAVEASHKAVHKEVSGTRS